MGEESRTVQWESNNTTCRQSLYSDRCIQAALESILRTRGVWSKEEQGLRISCIELLAIKYALLSFHKQIESQSYYSQVDNMTALSYLMKMGGTTSLTMIKISKNIWNFLIKEKTMITAEYLPGIMNIKADWESKHTRDSSEWKLSPKVFRKLCQKVGAPEIDLFTSCLSNQIPLFFSWKPDPFSAGVDALQQP